MIPYARDALAAAYSARAAPRVTFLGGRAEALPVQTASIDAVVSTLVRGRRARRRAQSQLLCDGAPAAALPASAAARAQVLCSVADPQAALGEVARVLRPGSGVFLYLEHTAAGAARPLLRAAQRCLDPLQQALADNCHLTRDLTARQLRAHGLSPVHERRFDVPGLGLIAPHVAGLAVRCAD